MSKAAELAALIGSQTALSNRNLVINGAMQVAQRGTSATSVSTEGYKCVDRMRWTMDTTSAVFTLSQSTDVPSGQGFAKSFKAEVTTADTSLAANAQTRFEYRFEGQDLQQLAKGTSNAKKVTLSFWVKAFQTGTYVINLQDTDNSRLIAATYTIDTSATWEYKTVTFAGDTSSAFTNDANLSLVIHWYLGAGSNYTSGTLAAAWESLTSANRAVGQTVDIATSTSNYWAITGVQLEVGEQATPFEHRSFGDELARCKRYYQRWDATGSDATSNKPIGAGVWYSTTQVLAMFNYDEMRAAPSFSTDSTGFVKAYDGGASTVRSGGNGLDSIGTKAARFNFTVSTARTEGDGTMIQLDDSGSFLALDAEL
jgi:hypothetical protein